MKLGISRREKRIVSPGVRKKTVAPRRVTRQAAPVGDSSDELELAAIAFANARRALSADRRLAGLQRALEVAATDKLHNAANRYGLLVAPEAEFVLDGFDRVVASPAYADNRSLPGGYVTSVLDINDPERFDDWEPRPLRALLASWLRFCPDREARAAVKRVIRELRSLEEFEAECIDQRRKLQAWMALSPADRRAKLNLRGPIKTLYDA